MNFYFYEPNAALVKVALQNRFKHLHPRSLMAKIHLALVAHLRIDVTTFWKKWSKIHLWVVMIWLKIWNKTVSHIWKRLAIKKAWYMGATWTHLKKCNGSCTHMRISLKKEEKSIYFWRDSSLVKKWITYDKNVRERSWLRRG